MRCGYLWGKTQWVRHYWLFNRVQQGYANNRGRKGLVSPQRNCRWSFFLTSLFITMSTKFGHSLAHLQNGRRKTQFSRDILCPVFIISFLADQDPLKLCISSQLLSTQETKSALCSWQWKSTNKRCFEKCWRFVKMVLNKTFFLFSFFLSLSMSLKNLNAPEPQILWF